MTESKCPTYRKKYKGILILTLLTIYAASAITLSIHLTSLLVNGFWAELAAIFFVILYLPLFFIPKP